MSGTVYKRCTGCGTALKGSACAKCGPGARISWAYRAYVGKDAEGRWIRRLRSGFATKREAERALRETLAAVEDRMLVPASNLTPPRSWSTSGLSRRRRRR